MSSVDTSVLYLLPTITSIPPPCSRLLSLGAARRTHLFQVHDALGQLRGELVLAARAAVAVLPVAVHDRLQDGGERGDADPGADEHGVLRPENVAGRRAVRTVNVDLRAEERAVLVSDVSGEGTHLWPGSE